MRRAARRRAARARARRLHGRARLSRRPRPARRRRRRSSAAARPPSPATSRRAAGGACSAIRCSTGWSSRRSRANTDLRVAAANLRRARAVLRETRSGRLPDRRSLGAAPPTAGNRATSSDSRAGDRRRYDVGIDASYQVDLFGRIRRAIQASRADVGAVQAAFDVSRITVAAETARAYADACSAGRQLAVARETPPHPGADLRPHPPPVRRRPRHRARDQPGRRAARAGAGDGADARGAAPDGACSGCRC